MRLQGKYLELEFVLKMEEPRKKMMLPKGIRKVYFVSVNPADRHLIQLAIEELPLEFEFVFFKSGEEFLQSLQDSKTHFGNKDLLFLDYFLVRKSGLEILKTIRSDTRYAELPVLMMVPAMFDRILEASYKEGANCCILMPIDFHELITTLKGVLSYWNHMLQERY